MILYILYIHLQYAKIIKTILGTRAQLKRYKLRKRSSCCHLSVKILTSSIKLKPR